MVSHGTTCVFSAHSWNGECGIKGMGSVCKIGQAGQAECASSSVQWFTSECFGRLLPVNHVGSLRR